VDLSAKFPKNANPFGQSNYHINLIDNTQVPKLLRVEYEISYEDFGGCAIQNPEIVIDDEMLDLNQVDNTLITNNLVGDSLLYTN
jgi:hypothetical protein